MLGISSTNENHQGGFQMTRKSWVKTVLFIVLVSAMLLSAVGIAYAATTSKSTCESFYYGGAKVAKVCMRASFEHIGSSVRVKSKWTTKAIYAAGWSIYTYDISSRPSSWTTGTAWVQAGYGFLKSGKCKGTTDCKMLCTSISGKLICSKNCN